MDDNKLYFDHGQYYFGYNFFSQKEIPENNLLPFDKYYYEALSDIAELGLVIAESDGKIGVFTMYSCGQGGYGEQMYSSNIFPFIYDELLLSCSIEGNGIGFAAVRINHHWGVLRLEDHSVEKKRQAARPCMMVIPCKYNSFQEAVSQIRSNDYHPEYGWRNPMRFDWTGNSR